MDSSKTDLCNSTITLFAFLSEPSSIAMIWPGEDESNYFFRNQYTNIALLYRVLYPSLFGADRVNNDYRNNLLDGRKSYSMINVGVNAENRSIVVFEVEALPCIKFRNDFWYIFSSYNDEIYFTAEATRSNDNDNEPSNLTGILEPYPQLHSYRKNVSHLENEFVKGLRWVGKFEVQKKGRKRV